jgi:hypothetical protein
MLDKPVSQKLPVARCYGTYVMNGSMEVRRRRTQGHCQCLESSLAAFRASHRHMEEEEEEEEEEGASKLVALATAMKREKDAE